MIKRVLLPLLFGMILATLPAIGQQITQETQHKISKKAIKGGLIDFQVNEESGQIQLTYLLNERRDDMEVERYTFDMNFNLLNQQEEILQKQQAEDEFTYFQAKSKGPTSLLQAGNDLKGQMVLKSGFLQWQPMGRIWITKFITEEKFKPKGTDGKKLGLVAYRTNAPKFMSQTSLYSVRPLAIAEGDVTTVAMLNEGIPWKTYVINVFDAQNFDRKAETMLDLDYMYYPAIDAEMANGDIGIVFVPLTQDAAIGAAYFKNKEDLALPVSANQDQCIFVRIDPDGNVVEQTYFSHPYKQNWMTILDYGNDVGVAMLSESQNKTMGVPPIIGRQPGVPQAPAGPDVFCLVKISDGKAVYHSETPLADMLSNAQIPQGSKVKLPKSSKPDKFFSPITGYRVQNVGVTNRSDYLMCLVDQQMHMLQFNTATGTFEQLYFMDGDSKAGKAEQIIFEGGQGASAIWISFEFNPEKPEERWANVVRVDQATGEMSEVVIPGKRDFQLDEAVPFTPINGGKDLIVFGRDGKTLFFGKMALQ
jgi:hypothetical protein